MEPGLDGKLGRLRALISGYGSLLVAFSGGVDSTLLLKVAHDTLGEKAVAVTARLKSFPEREYEAAKSIARNIGARHITVDSECLGVEEFRMNLPDRCYFCKKELFGKFMEIARAEGIRFVADGDSGDDLKDYRPGSKAAAELGVVSPLREAGLSKEDIRALSKELGLSTWDKPPFACLASRFPCGTEITEESLDTVDRAEQVLLDLGFRQVRVRHYGTMARIEVGADEVERFSLNGIRNAIVSSFKELGYRHVCLDLEGYRTGSMNETLGLRDEKNR